MKFKLCEVCEKTNTLEEVLDLGKHPLCDDLIPIKKRNIFCKEYPIVIIFCKNCRTAHQKYQVKKEILFPKNYHYRARVTKSVLTDMEDLVNCIEERFGSLNKKYCLDIGCNDGSLLNFFKKKGARTIGVEPTNAANDSAHVTIKDFFSKKVALQILKKIGYPDIITFTNVFAHISDLNNLLDNLKIIIGPNTKIVIENHYLGSILDYGQFDTFYHEHPRTYSLTSFHFIAKKLNLDLFDYQFVSRYGGNIRVYLSRTIKSKKLINENNFKKKFIIMKNSIFKWKNYTNSFIKKYNFRVGKIRAKAFPGRAAILIKLLGVNENHISAVYEIKNSKKVYHYVPGTRIPILPEVLLFKKKDKKKTILNLAWHLPLEVRKNLIKNKYIGQVFDIKEFKKL
jgi:hypothetical protein